MIPSNRPLQPNDACEASHGASRPNHYPERHHTSIKETIMPISFMECMSGPVRRHLSILLVRIRRIVNQSVAGMLARRERQASRLMPRDPGDRRSKAAGNRSPRPIIRSALLGLMIAGLSSPVFTRQHRAAQAQQAVWPQRRHGCRQHSDWSIVAASRIPALLDRRS
ncbi:hypothetical protein H8B02_33915 [Bradyrhizobium sp. Pear77]|uniref:hypothetical protein n=1 Tax=Bradyrhizobium altum TaxID=1571202 RepID=UPI001E2A83C5|nr:hypothetical protein [Bradyrhizobium altum]MCC8958237.1 hypothetical protein [Bradyrhizobium altum]